MNSRSRVMFNIMVTAGLLCGSAIAFGQAKPPDTAARELAMKIQGPFTLATVGDIVLLRPTLALADPALQEVVKLVRDADFAVGNLESIVVDPETFDGPQRGFMGTGREIAADIKAMGFDIVNRANNHSWDGEYPGLLQTHQFLREVGVGYVGAGKDLEEARAARYVVTPKGRVGLVGMTTPNGRPDARVGSSDPPVATERFGEKTGRPGINGIRLDRALVVSPEHFEQLKKIREAIYARRTEYKGAAAAPPPPKESFELFLATNGIATSRTSFKAGPKPGTMEYTMDPQDLQGTLRSIKNGKQFSDFMVATIHAHQSDNVLQSYGDTPPNFLVDLAHKALDTGADAFFAHGPHTLRGVEIYKGKPIFYGMGPFFWQIQWSPIPLSDFDEHGLNPFTTDKTDAELTDEGTRPPTATGSKPDYEGLLALSKYDKGRLVEVVLYPIEQRYSEPLSQVGTPRIATGNLGRQILERVQALSKPFGTTVAIDGNVGRIKVTP